MSTFTRRRFLATAVVAAAGVVTPRRLRAQQRGLDQFVIPSVPCTIEDLTPAVDDNREFTERAPARGSLIEPGVTGVKIAITGSVIGLKCGRVKGARIDFWQADATGVYDPKGFRLRGHQVTDADGRYRLETVTPGPYAKRAPHINARVHPPGKPALSTQLFFPGDPRNARDPHFKPKLLLKRAGAGAPTAFTFDFVLDI